jgi:tetratricopeptide (TPR) repeat protein
MSDALFALGTMYYLQQEKEKAAECYARLLAAHPRHAGAHYQLGKMLLAQGRTDEAIEHLRTAVEIDPAAKGAHYQLARAYRMAGRAADAAREAAAFRSLGQEAAEQGAGRPEPLQPLPRQP